MSEPTRSRLLNYILEHPAATVGEISRALGITTAGARYHLSRLECKGVLRLYKQPVSSIPMRGRPARIIRLNAESDPRNLEILSASLLDLVFHENVGTENVHTKLSFLVEKIIRRPPPGLSLQKRLVIAIQQLELLQYRPRWEARSRGPHFIFLNCPFAGLVASHPELCRLDLAILQELLGTGIETLETIATTKTIQGQCIFRIF